jgi:hypothetical protein
MLGRLCAAVAAEEKHGGIEITKPPTRVKVQRVMTGMAFNENKEVTPLQTSTRIYDINRNCDANRGGQQGTSGVTSQGSSGTTFTLMKPFCKVTVDRKIRDLKKCRR